MGCGKVGVGCGVKRVRLATWCGRMRWQERSARCGSRCGSRRIPRRDLRTSHPMSMSASCRCTTSTTACSRSRSDRTRTTSPSASVRLPRLRNSPRSRNAASRPCRSGSGSVRRMIPNRILPPPAAPLSVGRAGRPNPSDPAPVDAEPAPSNGADPGIPPSVAVLGGIPPCTPYTTHRISSPGGKEVPGPPVVGLAAGMG